MNDIWFQVVYRDGASVIQTNIKGIIFESIEMNDEELKNFWELLGHG